MQVLTLLPLIALATLAQAQDPNLANIIRKDYNFCRTYLGWITTTSELYSKTLTKSIKTTPPVVSTTVTSTITRGQSTTILETVTTTITRTVVGNRAGPVKGKPPKAVLTTSTTVSTVLTTSVETETSTTTIFLDGQLQTTLPPQQEPTMKKRGVSTACPIAKRAVISSELSRFSPAEISSACSTIMSRGRQKPLGTKTVTEKSTYSTTTTHIVTLPRKGPATRTKIIRTTVPSTTMTIPTSTQFTTKTVTSTQYKVIRITSVTTSVIPTTTTVLTTSTRIMALNPDPNPIIPCAGGLPLNAIQQWAGQGTQIFNAGTFETVDPCKEACDNAAGCIHWTYIRESGDCQIYHDGFVANPNPNVCVNAAKVVNYQFEVDNGNGAFCVGMGRCGEMRWTPL